MLLDYCLTSHHVHLLVDAQDRLEVSRFIRSMAGEFARSYNPRKHRMNAWRGVWPRRVSASPQKAFMLRTFLAS
jgi:REP element-mobilizing transposase RayT